MKRLLSVLFVIGILISSCIMGIGTVAFAAEESPEEDFLVYDGVLEEYIGEGGDVVIPASLGVKEIAGNSFSHNNDIVSLVIPEGVTKIGMYAFTQCESLEEATLPYSLTEMQACFNGCTSLTSIAIPGNLAEVQYGTFSGCESLSDVVISYGVEEIHQHAFQRTSISKIVIPKTVDEVYHCAFANLQVQKTEIIVCNPDCNMDLVENLQGKIVPNHIVSLANNLGRDVTYVVPRDSAVGEFLENNIKENTGKSYVTWDGYNVESYNPCYKVRYKDIEYFDELEENQKGYGVQKPTSTTTGNGNGDNTSPVTQVGNSQQQNNNQNTNGNGNIVTTTDNNSSNLIIIVVCVFGGIMLIVIVVVVILATTGKLFGGKKSNNNSELEQLKAQIAAMQSQAAATTAEDETTPEDIAESDDNTDE